MFGLVGKSVSGVVRQSFSRFHHSLSSLQIPLRPFDLEREIRERNEGSHKEATAPLAAYLGCSSLEPGEVINFTKDQLEGLLTTHDLDLEKAMYRQSHTVQRKYCSNKVHFRGLLEFSNMCEKNCLYCGLGADVDVERFTIPPKQMVEATQWAHENGYGSIMLQSDRNRIKKLCDTIRDIKASTLEDEQRRFEEAGRDPADASAISIALSVGELPEEFYHMLREAGADRYLLRIESSNPELYNRIHPQDGNHSWEQTGSGIMIGLPTQTISDLANDILFFKNEELDMIGMGPYCPQASTPVGAMWEKEFPEAVANLEEHENRMFDLSTRVIALTRMILGGANMAASTALAALNTSGREIALTRGSNILMPVLTTLEFRKYYQLYDNRPGITDDRILSRDSLVDRVRQADLEVGFHEWGDPVRYHERSEGQVL